MELVLAYSSGHRLFTYDGNGTFWEGADLILNMPISEIHHPGLNDFSKLVVNGLKMR